MWLVIVIAFAVIVIGVGIAWWLGGRRFSRRPQSWLLRLGALAIGTTLLSLAVLAPPEVADAAGSIFPGVEDNPGEGDALDAVRVALLVLGALVLIVPGTWIDVTVGVLATLIISAGYGDIEDRRFLATCPEKPKEVASLPAEPKKRRCPLKLKPAATPAADAVRVLIPKDRLVAPVLELPARSEADLVAVVLERDDDGPTTTVARRYQLEPVTAVPAKKLSDDVSIDFRVTDGAKYERFLADLTAAKTLRLLPHREAGKGATDAA